MSVLWLECYKCGNITGFIDWEEEMFCDDCQRGFCDVSYLYDSRNIYEISDEDSPF